VSDVNDLPGDEPPVSPTEDRLGRFLDEAVNLLKAGRPIDVAALLADRPDLVERGRRDLEALEAVRRVSSAGDPDATVFTPAPATYPDPLPGEFRILQALGEGTFGKVWLADDLHLGRQVALKTLHFPADADSSALAALRKEANILAGLRHSNIVQVYAWRQSGNEHYLVLEYVPGGSLADLLKKEGPLPWQRAARYIATAAEGLREVHERGIVHRDIKAGNLLWDAQADEAKLSDFGVAGTLGVTRTVAGTPVFMAPEALQGRATAASDVYALAATLFHLVTGELPFSGTTWDEVVAGQKRGLAERDERFCPVPARLEGVIRAALAANPGDRTALSAFIDLLWAAINHTLVDELGKPAGEGAAAAPVQMRMEISRKVGASWQRVATTHPQADPLSRDVRRVPPRPPQMRVRTGEPLRLEVEVDRSGYLAVFNVGPTGHLNLLYPVAEYGDSPTVQARQVVSFDDLVLDGPAGRERMFAVCSSKELPVSEQELRSLTKVVEQATEGSRASRSSRDIVRVRQAVQQAGCRVVVLELDHEPM
jgi:serine/threonine-protein kinase